MAEADITACPIAIHLITEMEFCQGIWKGYFKLQS